MSTQRTSVFTWLLSSQEPAALYHQHLLDKLDLAYTLELSQQSCCANTIHWAYNCMSYVDAPMSSLECTCHLLTHHECQTLQHQWVLVYESYTQQPTEQCESGLHKPWHEQQLNAAAQQFTMTLQHAMPASCRHRRLVPTVLTLVLGW